MTSKLAVVLLALALTDAAIAETVTGRVVGISDGDTLTLLVAKSQVKVRLADIDTQAGIRDPVPAVAGRARFQQ
jgi:endonuclease YncB( thermonuclease family)